MVKRKSALCVKRSNNTRYYERNKDLLKAKKKNLQQLRKSMQNVNLNVQGEKCNLRNGLLYKQFLAQIQDGPTEICVCCGALSFPRQIKYLCHSDIDEKFSSEFSSLVFCVKHEIDIRSKFCVTCYNYVKIGKIPSLCLSNGLDYPEVPECFKQASVVEERFCALRIPFMSIKKLGHERQCGLKGQIVNVPIQCETIVSALPRSMDDTYTIQLHLKRKMEYNHDYMCETFRPNLVLKIFNHLKATPLYRQYNVCLSDDWRRFEHYSEDDTELFVVSESDIPVAEELALDQSSNQSNSNSVQNVDENIGCEDTLLNSMPIESLTLAPGEGQVPLSLLLDPHAEELSFPLVFFGRARDLKVKISYNKIVKSALKHYSGKCNRVDMLFLCIRNSNF